MPLTSSPPPLALLELQRAFARSLVDEREHGIGERIADERFNPAERLRIYRNTCRGTLVATLRLTYSAVERIVGREFFESAAERYVAAHPAASGYLNDYGGSFATFLAGFAPASSLAYLPDVARYEWALNVAANAPDSPALDAAALLGVAPERHAELRFAPHPSVSLLALRYPADEIADAVLGGDEAAMGEVDLASGPVYLVVHRGPEGLKTERLTVRAYEFVARLCAGEPLERVIEAAPEQAPLLLAEQLAKGRLRA